MASLIGRALPAPQNSAPVPMGDQGSMRLPGLVTGSNVDAQLMRAYNTNGTVRSNVGMIAGAVAGPAWKLFKQAPSDGRRRYTTNDQGSDERVEVVQHQALTVLNTPATIQVGPVTLPVWTRFSLFEISGIWLEATGKSHWIVDYDQRAPFPLGLWPVRPDRMTPIPDSRNYLAGWVYSSPDGSERIPLLPTEVIFNRYPNPEDTYGGSGPVASVLVDIEAARYAGEWNRNYFVNSAEPGGVIVADHKLEDDEFNELVNRWRETHRGVARAHRIAVLENGQSWVPNAHTMRDMDFAALRGVSRDIIREALAMHKVMTGVSDDVNRANAQTGEEVFANWQVAPRLDRWRDVLNSQFLPLFGSTGEGVEFDYVYPTPANREQDALELSSKSAAVATLVGAGYDPAAVLEVVGLPAMPVAPKPPPSGLPPGTPAPPGAGAGEAEGEQAAESQGGGDAANAWRRALAPFNGGRVMIR